MGSSCETLYAGLCDDSTRHVQDEYHLSIETVSQTSRKRKKHRTIDCNKQTGANADMAGLSKLSTEKELAAEKISNIDQKDQRIDKGKALKESKLSTEQISKPLKSSTVKAKEPNYLYNSNNIRVICRFRPANLREKEHQTKEKYFNSGPEIHSDGTVYLSFDQQTQNRMNIKRKCNSKKRRIGNALSPKKSEKLVFAFIRHCENELDIGFIPQALFQLFFTFYYIDEDRWCAVFDYIFDTDATQKKVFDVVGVPSIHEALKGFNTTIFAYGQHGAGKTYSMIGANHQEIAAENGLEAMGIIPQSFIYLFKRLELAKESGQLLDYNVSIQMLQIYNNSLLDLMNINSDTKLCIKTDFEKNNVYVKDLTAIDVSSARDAMDVLIQGRKNRITSTQKFSAITRRFELIIMMTVEQRIPDGSIMTSNMNFAGNLYKPLKIAP